MDGYREQLGRPIVEAIQETGLDPIGVVVAVSLVLAGYYAYRWTRGAVPQHERGGVIAYWVLTGVGVIVAVVAWTLE